MCKTQVIIVFVENNYFFACWIGVNTIYIFFIQSVLGNYSYILFYILVIFHIQKYNIKISLRISILHRLHTINILNISDTHTMYNCINKYLFRYLFIKANFAHETNINYVCDFKQCSAPLLKISITVLYSTRS